MNLVDYTKYFGLGNMFAKLENSQTAKGVGTAIGIVGGLAGLGATVHGIAKAASDKDKFTVVYLSSNGPQKVVVKAQDKISARNQVQSRSNGTDYKVFHSPQENDNALDYYDQLKSQS